MHYVRAKFVGYLLRYRLHAADHALVEQDALVDEVLESSMRCSNFPAEAIISMACNTENE